MKNIRESSEGYLNSEEGRCLIVLEGIVFQTVFGDLGEDFSAIDSKTMEKLLKVKIFLAVQNFKAPIKLGGSFEVTGTEVFTDARSTIMSVTI